MRGDAFRNDQETIAGYTVTMSREKPASAVHHERLTDQSERRWDRWAWLTLAAGLVLLLLPLFTSLMALRYPTDGWDSTAIGNAGIGFGITGPHRMVDNLSSKPSGLHSEDVVVAIDDHPLTDDSLPPVSPGVQVGQTLRYTVRRGDITLDVDVPIFRLTPADTLTQVRLDFDENPENVVFSLLVFAVAVAVFALRPGSLAARYLFLFATFKLGLYLSTSGGILAGLKPSWLSFLSQLNGWGWVYVFTPAITLIVLVFPVRKWPVRRFPRLTPFLLMGLPLLISIAANAVVWFGGYLRAAELLLPLTIYSAGLMLLLAPATLIHNLLTIRDPLPRAQMRWIALGFGLGLVVPMALMIFNFTVLGSIEVITRLGNVALVFLPVCLAIGITRYRLFDIDVIIRRTTSYAIITALLVLVYLGSVIVLQNLFGRVTGQNSTAAVVLSTLLIAALFLPVRRRVQDLIDRRFNRTRYNAEKTLERFAATARDETDLDALLAELQRVIQETMQPESVSIWLREPGTGFQEGVGRLLDDSNH